MVPLVVLAQAGSFSLTAAGIGLVDAIFAARDAARAGRGPSQGAILQDGADQPIAGRPTPPSIGDVCCGRAWRAGAMPGARAAALRRIARFRPLMQGLFAA